jgi:hypothetical protein
VNADRFADEIELPEIASDRDFRHIEAKRKVPDGCQPTLLQLVRDELPPKRRKHGALSAGIGVDRY